MSQATTGPFRLVSLLTVLAVSPCWGQQAPASAAPRDSPQVTAPTATPATPARDVPRPDQLEPAVDTSATPAAEPTGNARGSGKPAAPAVPVRPEQALPPGQDKRPPVAAGPKSATAGKAQDRLELDTTQITGNRELPKVLYIVPWKRSDLGDLVGRPANSLLDEVLAPVDRDVFKRENRYYDALKPDSGTGAAPSTGAAPGAAATPAAGGKN